MIPEVEAQDADDITINIGTVHSVKGMTHCATMYVKTSYNNKYESEYMIEDKTTGRERNKVRTETSPFLMQDLQPNGNMLLWLSGCYMLVFLGRHTCYVMHRKKEF